MLDRSQLSSPSHFCKHTTVAACPMACMPLMIQPSKSRVLKSQMQTKKALLNLTTPPTTSIGSWNKVSRTN